MFGCNLVDQNAKYIRLVNLNLQDNFLCDGGVSQILLGLKNLKLKKLNLSYNHITDDSGEAFETFLNENTHLKELYLYWNKISGKGGLYIARGLQQNSSNIAVVNLAHNSLGSGGHLCGPKMIKAWNTKTIQSIKHVDLSYNNFHSLECISMGTELNNNKTLYGLHMDGNSNYYLDPQGFIKCSAERKDQVIVERKPIKGVKCQFKNEMQNLEHTAFDSCWICEGWIQ